MSDDLIKKQAAIDALNAEGITKNMRAHRRILSLPSAERRGRWEKTGKKRYFSYDDVMYPDFEWRCSCCGKAKWASEQQQPTDPYCSNCGALMRSEEE